MHEDQYYCFSRVCFQAVLSLDTILTIVSCSSFFLCKHLQMVGNMCGPMCRLRGIKFLHLFGMSQKFSTFRAFSTKAHVRSIICTVLGLNAINWVAISFPNELCNATARFSNGQASAQVMLAFFAILYLVRWFSEFANNRL